MTQATSPHINTTGKFAILAIGLLPALAISAIAVMLPAIADAFGRGDNDIQIKMVSTAAGLGMLIGAPLGGLVADRIGRPMALLITTALFGVLGAIIMAMSDLWSLIALRFLIGLIAGAITVCIAAVMGDYFSGNQLSRWIGYAGATSAGLTVIANPLTGLLTDYSWRMGFSPYLLAFPIFLAILLGLPRVAKQADAVSSTRGGGFFLPWNKVPFSALLLAGILGTLSTGTSLYWPFRLREVGISKASEIAIYALPQVVFITLMMFLYGTCRRFMSIRSIFVVSAILSAVGLAIIAFGQNAWIIVMGLSIEGLGIGMMSPNLSNYALAISPVEYRGRILGLIKGAVFGSPFVTQFLLLPLSHVGGSTFALLGICGMALFLALIVFQGWVGKTEELAPA
jgi:MFS family permease